MSWNWRSSKKIGGVRVNLSTKGIGWSAGVKGFRVGTDASGRQYTHASIPGTGLYNRQYNSKSKIHKLKQFENSQGPSFLNSNGALEIEKEFYPIPFGFGLFLGL